MNQSTATASAIYPTGYTCQWCGQWVSTYSTAAHVCPSNQVSAWPSHTATDPKLLALMERIAVALEAIVNNPLRADSLAPQPTPGRR